MKLLATIREKDTDPSRENLPDDFYTKFRQAVRMVLFDKEGNVATNFWPIKPPDQPYECYALPGGGVDEGEDLISALKREAVEEAGCQIKDIEELGMVIQYGGPSNLRQETYVYTCKVDGEKGKPLFTEKEIRDALEIRWYPIDQLIKLITTKNNPRSFIQKQALIILNGGKKSLSANSTE